MMEQLKDIKGLVEVSDYSLYYLLGVVSIVVVLLMVLGFFIYRFLNKKERMTQQKLARSELKHFKVSDAKESAYRFSHLAQYAADEAQQAKLDEILKDLELYKYKKEVPELDAALKEKMEQFIKEVSHG